jgi:hypothetical protein
MHEDGVTGHRLTIIQPEVGTQSADAEDNELRPVRHAGKDGSVDQRIGRAFSADRQVSSATSDWVNLIELRYPGTRVAMIPACYDGRRRQYGAKDGQYDEHDRPQRDDQRLQ